MGKHPLEDLMDNWLEMMDGVAPVWNTKRQQFIRNPKNAKSPSIGEWEDRNGEIAITVDMPGIHKKDIELTVDKHIVRVVAITEDRDYSFNKEIQMELNPSKVKANFNNGVLDITIKKAQESQGKKIAIK